MEIEVVDGSVRVNVSGTYSAQELRELLGKLANAHGEATDCRTQDTHIPFWEGIDADFRRLDGGILQISVLSLFGWSQVRLTEQTAKPLLSQISAALGAVEVGITH